jgi:hypothetical protein
MLDLVYSMPRQANSHPRQLEAKPAVHRTARLLLLIPVAKTLSKMITFRYHIANLHAVVSKSADHRRITESYLYPATLSEFGLSVVVLQRLKRSKST